MRLLTAGTTALILAGAFSAHAGGPLGTCYGSPVKYPGTGAVTLRYDLGGLGSRSKAAADALVTNAISFWTNVPTSTVTLARGADLPVDVTTANVNTYYGRWSDGINPVIYDTNGSIIDMILGTGASNQVLGFAGSAWSDNGAACQYVEGQAVINGKIAVSDATMTTVLAHEIGHLIGMDHTQLDGSQSLASSNYPLMYPIAYRSLLSLHEDDTAAVTALYPDSNVGSVYGEVSGTFTTVAGTPVRGANIFAQGTGGTYSIVSDYREQNTGYFRMLLPPGTYTLRAEAIDTSFTGGSSVGPYSEDWTQPSFQPPLYASGGTASVAPSGPMPTVTLGTQVTITAGCAATATFHTNGTGNVGGNCAVAVPSQVTTIAPSGTVSTARPTFTWNAVPDATAYNLLIQTTSGAQVSFTAVTAAAAGCSAGTGTCSAPSPVALVDAPYYWFMTAQNSAGSSTWSTARAFTVSTAVPVPPAPTLGQPSGIITTLTPTFLWNPAAGATSYTLRVQTNAGTVINMALTLAQALCPKNSGACAYAATAPLAANTVHTWQVAASNGTGSSAFSAATSFTTPSNVAPAAPVAGSPSGVVTTTTPQFLWTPAPGATGYTLQVMNSGGALVGSTSLDLVRALCPRNTGACGFTFPAAFAAGVYTWQVRAENAIGVSAFTAPLAFTISGNAVPAAPVLGSPSGSITMLTPMFLWNPAPNATSYTLRLMSGGTTVLTQALTLAQALCPKNTGACGYTAPSALASGTAYTWQVSASNSAGSSPYSATATFFTP
jgi:hypothetical protein